LFFPLPYDKVAGKRLLRYNKEGRLMLKISKKGVLLMAIFSGLGAILASCSGSKEAHTYKEVEQFLNEYHLDMSSTTPENSNRQVFPYDLKDSYVLTCAKSGNVVTSADTGKITKVTWTFQIKNYEGLEFSVTSAPQGGSEYRSVYAAERFVLTTDYYEKSQEFALAEFIASKADDPEFGGESWCQYQSREELEKAAGYFLEYLDFLNNHELKLAIPQIRFFDPDIPGFDSHIDIRVGLAGGKLAPLYFVQEEKKWHAYEDFVNSMLRIYDIRHE
jgi:hypothetical protein